MLVIIQECVYVIEVIQYISKGKATQIIQRKQNNNFFSDFQWYKNVRALSYLIYQ